MTKQNYLSLCAPSLPNRKVVYYKVLNRIKPYYNFVIKFVFFI